jgi:hypothetical protein
MLFAVSGPSASASPASASRCCPQPKRGRTAARSGQFGRRPLRPRPARKADGRRRLSEFGPDHRRTRRPHEHSRTPPAPPDQQGARLPQLRRLHQRPPHRGSQAAPGGAGNGARADHQPRLRSRLFLAGAVQPRLPRAHRHEPVAIPRKGASAANRDAAARRSRRGWSAPSPADLFFSGPIFATTSSSVGRPPLW